MKSLLPLALVAVLLTTGCESGPAVRRVEVRNGSPIRTSPQQSAVKRTSPPVFQYPAATPDRPAPIVNPATVLQAKVVSYNDAGRFVVLSFPIDQSPANDSMLGVFRDGKKVGDVKITGPRTGQNIIADLASGEAQPGDEVRAR